METINGQHFLKKMGIFFKLKENCCPRDSKSFLHATEQLSIPLNKVPLLKWKKKINVIAYGALLLADDNYMKVIYVYIDWRLTS